MKIGLESLTPAAISASRITLGLITLIVISIVIRVPIPPRESWFPLILASAMLTGIPWALFAFAEERVSTAFAGIINGATPLMTLLAILIAFPEERPTRQRMLGLGIGFFGILVVVGIWNSMGASSVVGAAACLLAITLYGISYPYVRRRLTGGPTSLGLEPLSLATGVLFFGAIQSWILVAIFGVTTAPITTNVIWAMLALGILGSGIAYVLHFTIIKNSDATTASTVTFATTMVAVVVAAVVLGETITWNQPAGAALVIIGGATAQGLLHPDRWRRSKSSP